ncbi:hypothetical protein M8J76_010554 [Diaphorina citri]|nr:hypothetical protein M8J75_007436 [Diaphorina citri]KAI5737153.1 hypothetical protein M8J76_010554 [Diaphorina citri]KAI5742768.1 hypothetical protein M8J77_011109 [Diaphorina citri]
MSTKKDPCKVHACAIQKCLKNNNFQESLCLEYFEYLRKCCVKFHASSISCSGIDITTVYIKNVPASIKESTSER